jgi:hypothetical protein
MLNKYAAITMIVTLFGDTREQAEELLSSAIKDMDWVSIDDYDYISPVEMSIVIRTLFSSRK